jgi:hypothetical protein
MLVGRLGCAPVPGLVPAFHLGLVILDLRKPRYPSSKIHKNPCCPTVSSSLPGPRRIQGRIAATHWPMLRRSVDSVSILAAPDCNGLGSGFQANHGMNEPQRIHRPRRHRPTPHPARFARPRVQARGRAETPARLAAPPPRRLTSASCQTCPPPPRRAGPHDLRRLGLVDVGDGMVPGPAAHGRAAWLRCAGNPLRPSCRPAKPPCAATVPGL